MSEALGPLAGLRVLELADEKGQFCGKLLGDLGADVVKIEPPGGAPNRHIGPFMDDVPHPDRSVSFWYYNTSKRGITLNLETADGRTLFRRLAATADIILETFKPGFLPSIGLGYDDLRAANPGLILCSLTPFGQTGPWRDYVSSDLLHMAAGGEMASCGYDEADVPNAPPIAPGGGNAWHMGCHYAYHGDHGRPGLSDHVGPGTIHRRIDPRGLRADDGVGHRQLHLPGRDVTAPDRTSSRRRRHTANSVPGQGWPLCHGADIGRLNPRNVKALADLMDSFGMAGDLKDERYQDPAVIAANASHIIDDLLAAFIASQPAETVYHAAQQRGFTWGAVRPAEALLDDAHLHDRGFWKQVEHPELGRSFVYPGEAAIYNGSPWRIARRAPLVGEHNTEIYCDALGLSRAEVSVLAESGVI